MELIQFVMSSFHTHTFLVRIARADVVLIRIRKRKCAICGQIESVRIPYPAYFHPYSLFSRRNNTICRELIIHCIVLSFLR